MKRTPLHRRAVGYSAVLSLSVLLSVITLVRVAVASPSNYVSITNNQPRWNGVGSYDWGNGFVNLSGISTGSNACTVTNNTNGSKTISCPGTNGLFDGGTWNGKTTPPTPPTFKATSDSTIVSHQFIVDPLSVDTNVPCPGGTGTVNGDPTVYTGSGSEKNGDLLSNDTWGSGSVPDKDDLANVYAVAHRAGSVDEIFFGAERNFTSGNGDSHIDFEFLQSKLGLTGNCSGSFTGSRTAGDLLLSVDFTKGGTNSPSTLGDIILYEWHCNAETSPNPKGSGVCDPPANGPSVPHYQQISSNNASFNVNSGGPVDSGGWAGRFSDGSLETTIDANKFMEGGLDLAAIGFTGCFSTFLPHTRSSQQFTATLKDFALVPFSNCVTPTVTTSLSSGGRTGATLAVEIGSSVTDQATLTGASGTPAGTMTYKVFSDSACSTTALFTSTKTLSGGVVPTSDPFTVKSTGTYYWQATYSGDTTLNPAGQNFGASSACTAEVLTVVDAAIGISPSATNEVNQTHTFTVTVTADDGSGSGQQPVSGNKPTVTISPAPSSTTDNCATTGTNSSGQCTVVINSTSAGTFTANASTTVTVAGVNLTRDTDPATSASAGPGGTGPATKIYVDASIGIAPSATNEVGNAHTFTITVTAVPADATTVTFNSITPSLTAQSEFVQGTDYTQSSTCGSPLVSGNTAACTLTINSTKAGTFTANASASVTMGGVTVTRDTDPATSASAGPGGTGPATKIYVDASISISPNGTNGVTDSHTFTVTVTAYNGSTTGTSVSGAKPTVTISNSNGATATITLNNCASTGTGSNGQCTVVISSPTAGTTTANASVTLTVGGLTLTRDTDPATSVGAGPGGSGPATKTWVAGMLTWLKKDNNSNLLGGATFQVCRTEDSSGTTLSPAECVTVVDNTGQSGYSGLDADPVAGQFKLTSLPPVTTAALGTADLPLGTYTIQETVAPSGFAVDPSVQTVVLTLTSLNSAAANAFVDTPIFFGNMYPTTTTCAQFNSGAPTETSGTYKLKSGVINSVSPGVIFYYTKFKAASSNVDIRQVVSQSVSSYLVAPQQINVYDANCNTVASNVRFTSVNSSGTQDITSLAVTLTPGNTYIIGVKYSVSSITGPAPNPATLTYNFATYDANKTTLLDRAPIPSFTLTKG